MSRVRRCVPPAAGRSPSETSGRPTRTLGASAAMRQSHASASSYPPPSALPLIAATVGKGSAARSLKIRWISRLARVISSADGQFDSIVRSAPATNWSGFALTMMRPRGRAARASSMAFARAAIIGGSMAFTLSVGRSTTIRAVSPFSKRAPAGLIVAMSTAGGATRVVMSCALVTRAARASLKQLEHDRRSVAARGARAGEAELHAAAAHLVRERRDEARAGRPEGVPERDGAAHDVHDVLVDTAGAVLLQYVEGREDLRGEGLVHLDEADVGERESGALQRQRDRVGRRDEELVGGVHGGVGVGADRHQAGSALGARALLGHEEDRRGAVGEWACDARRRARASFGVYVIGTFERLSAPPASTDVALPTAM